MNILNELTSKEHYYQSMYGLKPTEKQLALIETEEKHYKDRFERGTGCTYACVIKAIEYAIKNPESNVGIMSFARYGATYQFNRACMFLTRNSKMANYLYKRSACSLFINLINGSTIHFIPGTESIRGKRLDCAIIDGVGWMKPEQVKLAYYSTASSYGQVIEIDQDDILS